MRPPRRSTRICAGARDRRQPLGIGFLALGMSPKWTLAQTPVMPKGRYQIMARYMPKVGTRGLDMMFRTATVQANLDFSDEADMVRKLRVGLALQPLITALFANSPFTEGKRNGFLSMRSEIWRDTDNARAGMLPFAFEAGMGFERYVDYALDVPMYFVKRGDDLSRRRGRQLSRPARRAAGGAAGRTRDDLGLGQPSLDDFSRSAPQALSRNARRRRRPARAHLRAVGADGRPLLRLRRRSMRPTSSPRRGTPGRASSCATTRRGLRSLRESAGEASLKSAAMCWRWRAPASAAARASMQPGATKGAISPRSTSSQPRAASPLRGGSPVSRANGTASSIPYSPKPASDG